MSQDGRALLLQLRAGADLNTGDGTGAQYKAVAVGGTIAANNSTAVGLVQNKPKNGEDLAVLYLGHGKGIAGAALSAGDRVKITTSGYIAAVASGDGCVGKVITAASSGMAVEGLFNFINASTTY